MKDEEEYRLRHAIEAFDKKIESYGVQFERANIHSTSLQTATRDSLTDKNLDPIYAPFRKSLYHGNFDVSKLVSRSQWYAHVKDTVTDPTLAQKIKLELIDSHYNKLFVNTGEAYAMDRIAHLSILPTKVLSFGVQIKSFKQEYKSVRSILRAFEVISSFGTLELTKLLTDVALNAIKDAAESNGQNGHPKK